MKNLVTIIKAYRIRRQKAKVLQHLAEIRSSFQVKEHNGVLYLMCQGVPYKSIPAHASANEITTLLDEARQAMCDYAKSQPNDKVTFAHED